MERENYVGRRIKLFRSIRGWSQEKLALQAEINPAFLGHLERGLKVPTVTTLMKITDALGITLSEFFSDFQSETSDPDAEKQEILDCIVLNLRNLSASELTHIFRAVREMAELCRKR